MRFYMKWIHALIIIQLAILTGCTTTVDVSNMTKEGLYLEAESEKQWTGIAVDENNRVFTNFPKWSDDYDTGVYEIINGKLVAFPSENYNKNIFVCVQSVVVDDKNRLWVLDPANPQFKGVHPQGARLYSFDLKTNELIKIYSFPRQDLAVDSYLNDVRIDTDNNFAYITDSGVGGIYVVNLETGEILRRLNTHYSVKAETNLLVCDGYLWENEVASDGIALDKDNNYLYYTALTGHTLYRVKTSELRNKDLTPQVEMLAKIPATDGMIIDNNGNIWLGGLEDNSINKIDIDSGKLTKVVKSKDIKWADSFSFDKDGFIWFTTSQIHLPEDKRGKYKIYKYEY